MNKELELLEKTFLPSLKGFISIAIWVAAISSFLIFQIKVLGSDKVGAWAFISILAIEGFLALWIGRYLIERKYPEQKDFLK